VIDLLLPRRQDTLPLKLIALTWDAGRVSVQR
jgi:hypothetical protein